MIVLCPSVCIYSSTALLFSTTNSSIVLFSFIRPVKSPIPHQFGVFTISKSLLSFVILDIPPQLCHDTYVLHRLVRILSFSMVETLLPFKCSFIPTQNIFLLWINQTLFQSPGTHKKWLCDSVFMVGFWVNSWRFWIFGIYLLSPLLPMYVFILTELSDVFVRK